MTPRERSDVQVVTSASQIDAALAAGLTEVQVVALVNARHGWQSLGQLDPTTISGDLYAALEHPGAVVFDGIFVRRARAELSVAPRSVSS